MIVSFNFTREDYHTVLRSGMIPFTFYKVPAAGSGPVPPFTPQESSLRRHNRSPVPSNLDDPVIIDAEILPGSPGSKDMDLPADHGTQWHVPESTDRLFKHYFYLLWVARMGPDPHYPDEHDLRAGKKEEIGKEPWYQGNIQDRPPSHGNFRGFIDCLFRFWSVGQALHSPQGGLCPMSSPGDLFSLTYTVQLYAGMSSFGRALTLTEIL